MPTTRAVAAAAWLILAASCHRGDADPREQGRVAAISRALFADGRLWLLHDDGSLVSLSPDEGEARPAALPGKVVAICKQAGRLLGLVQGQGRWRLQARTARGWEPVASIPTHGEAFVALACADEALLRYASEAHAVGVRLEPDGRLDLYAPFGLADLFAMINRPNWALDNRTSYDAKAARAKAIWPKVTVIPWEGGRR